MNSEPGREQSVKFCYHTNISNIEKGWELGSAKLFIMRKMLTLCGHVLVTRNTLKFT